MKLSRPKFIRFKHRILSSDVWDLLEGDKPLSTFETDFCTFSPDMFRGYRLWPACVIHDYAYKHGGGTWKDRQEADAVFRRNIKTLVSLGGGGLVQQNSISWLYWGRVRIWGTRYYQYTEGEQPENRFERLREVYGLFRDKRTSS